MGIESVVSVDTTPKPIPQPYLLDDTLRPYALAVPSGDTPRRRTLPCAFLPVAGLYADRPRVNVACLDAHMTLRNHLDDLGVELMLDLMFWSSVILTGNQT